MALLNEASAVYYGTQLADRVYFGADLVWERTPDLVGFGLAPFSTSPFGTPDGLFGIGAFGTTGFGE